MSKTSWRSPAPTTWEELSSTPSNGTRMAANSSGLQIYFVVVWQIVNLNTPTSHTHNNHITVQISRYKRTTTNNIFLHEYGWRGFLGGSGTSNLKFSYKDSCIALSSVVHVMFPLLKSYSNGKQLPWKRGLISATWQHHRSRYFCLLFRSRQVLMLAVPISNACSTDYLATCCHCKD